MPPTGCGSGRDEMKTQIQALIDSNQVMLFSKSYCPFCVKVKDLFKELNVAVHAVELDLIDEGSNFQDILLEITGQKTVPNVFVNKTHVGGCDKTLQAHKNGMLQKLLEGSNETYEYDLIVIGGGSGGLACSKEAATLGKKVLVLDYVVPTPKGTTWGLGGTCVNVGCIPKKLMHQAALLGTALKDSRNFGWEYEEKVKHNWQTMIESISNYIGSLNWGYRVELRDKNVTYMNSYAEFVEPHKIKATNKRGKETFHTAATFVLATGERPRYLGIPGDKEYCITSDDLFSLPYCPGKTLVIGASYVALECAGFLAGIGLDVTVMVRSILLRGFDQEMAERAGTYMKDHGVKFIRPFVPTKIEQLEEGTPGKLKVTAKSTESDEMIEGEYNTVLIAVGRDACTGKIGLDKVGVEINIEQLEEGTPGKLKVTAKSTESGEMIEGEYNTVLIAVGRDACTGKIGLDKVGVEINEKNGKVPVNDEEQTNVPYIYAIGDILEGKWELTPVAIQAGKLLARRLFDGRSLKCDYVNVPTTVFTPLEYGCCGLSEEKAIELYGEENIEVYHSLFWPLECTVPSRDNNKCYSKIVCNKLDNERVVGFHYLGPNAGEVTQGFGVAIKCGLTKELLDNTTGIHPTCAEKCTECLFDVLAWNPKCGGLRLMTSEQHLGFFTSNQMSELPSEGTFSRT
ncbi:Thioredoxin reductase 3 [Acipenser ruthenus]|uniref:Thioredoxin reductase 3 n=1 Tax=Acipenser ruthenus TaxID=7906 RepID=A0A444V010_ACIRT|nr:Thioredoxin reductase 3 [Acipenser ruthenus]